MIEDELATLIRTAMDPSQSSTSRIAAIGRLGDDAPFEAAPRLVELAEKSSEPANIQVAAGAAMARIYIRHKVVEEAPLYDLTGPAYKSFDETVAADERNRGTSEH